MAQQIERLVTVWDARFDRLEEKLNKAVRATYGAASKIEKRFDTANDNIARRFGKGIGNTLRSDLEGLAGNAGRVTGALSGLGVAGLAGAAGVGALVLALNEAREAIAFGDAIADASAKVGVSTDTLQEYRFAIHQVGGEAADADAALAKFTQTLGKAQALPTKKTTRPFEALGLDPKQLGEADHALGVVLQRLAELKSETQRQALAKALGLEEFIPLAREGSAKIDELRAAAHRLGYVMDKDLVARAGEANDKLEDLQQIIDVQLKSAFVDMAPLVLNVAGALAAAAREVNKIASAIHDAMPVLQNWLNLLGGAGGQGLKSLPFIGPALQLREAGLGAARAGLDSAARAGRLKSQRRGIADLLSGKPVDLSPLAPRKPPALGSRDVIQTGGSKKGGAHDVRDTTDERVAQVNAVLAQTGRDLASAMLGLTINVEARAELEKAIIDQETKEAKERLNGQIASLADDKGISDEATRTRLAAQLELAKIETEKAALARKDLVDREVLEQKAQDKFSLLDAEIDSQEKLVSLQESIARTASERRALEIRLLDLAEQRAEAELELIAATKGTASVEHQIAEKRLQDLKSSRGAREQQVNQQTQGPLESFFRDLPQTTDQLNERMQALAAGGIQSVVDGLADAVTGARSLGDVFKGVVRQMLADITRLNLESALGGLMGRGGGGGGFGGLLSGLFGGGMGGIDFGFASSGGFNFTAPTGFTGFGFARGTDFAPGGVSLVGERGPELLNIPRGSQVIPNDILRHLSGAVSRPQVGNATSTTHSFSPTLNVIVQGGGSQADARRTGAQIGAEAMRHMAMARRKGFG